MYKEGSQVTRQLTKRGQEVWEDKDLTSSDEQRMIWWMLLHKEKVDPEDTQKAIVGAAHVEARKWEKVVNATATKDWNSWLDEAIVNNSASKAHKYVKNTTESRGAAAMTGETERQT